MDVLEGHQATEGRPRSTDWTTMGARILEAATIASAIHLEELSQGAVASGGREAASGRAARFRWDRERFDGNV